MRAATEPTSFGPYTLIRRLGVGGMAEVHVGTIERAGRFLKPVALKRVHPDIAADPALSATLIAEAKLSARLDHRNIVQTFDLDRVDDTLILVMEYVQGLDLGRLTERLWQHQVSFPIDLAVRVAERACRALEYAHALTDEQGVPLGLVHRDVSPQNVLVSQAGEVKLADFGIARTRTRVSDPDAGVIKGKHLYMSPEQACGEALDARSNLFSLGVVLWELLAGRRLHAPQPLPLLLEAVRCPRIPAPSALRPEVPPALDAVIARATAIDRSARFRDAGAFATALAQSLPTPVLWRDRGTALGALVQRAQDAEKAPLEPALPPTRGRLSVPPAPLFRDAPRSGETTEAGRWAPKTPESPVMAWAVTAAFVVATLIGLAGFLRFGPVTSVYGRDSSPSTELSMSRVVPRCAATAMSRRSLASAVGSSVSASTAAT